MKRERGLGIAEDDENEMYELEDQEHQDRAPNPRNT
jgi:hypothetical protein